MIRLVVAALFVFLAAVPAFASDPVETLSAAEAFMGGAIVVKGEGSAPTGQFTQAQKRIMALRAAKSVALREAAELLDGVTVTGETTVLNAAAESDTINTVAESVIKGATIVKEEYDSSTGTAVMFISIPMQGAAGALMPAVSGLVPATPVYSPGISASTTGYDGVIIDARGKALRPALVNRVLSKNGVVYDPSRVRTEVLAKSGAAAYTNDISKARGVIAKRGSVNPLVIKADSVERSTDVVLGPIEAAAVFYSNQMTNYLEAGKVVFVLD